MNDVYDLVRSLRAATWPRNRHFEAHATPTGAEARRLHRFLRAIEHDILTADTVRVRRHDRGVELEMAFGAVRAQRTVSLTHEEHALIVERAEIAARLQPENG